VESDDLTVLFLADISRRQSFDEALEWTEWAFRNEIDNPPLRDHGHLLSTFQMQFFPNFLGNDYLEFRRYCRSRHVRSPRGKQ